jgi:hypothetical protein
MQHSLNAGRSGVLHARQSNRVASLAPKHAAGRARRAAVQCNAMMASQSSSSSFMGTRRALVAQTRVSRTSRKGVVTKAMFERWVSLC